MANYIQQYSGTGVALVTPFDGNGEVDYPALRKLLNHTTPHVEYLVVNGTTGESPTISVSEKAKILELIIEHAGGKPVMYGVGGNNTANVTKELKELSSTGIDSILSISPYYNKPSQEGIYQHYMAVADASPVPVLMYNIPGRTASNMSAETTLRLAEHPNIMGSKEAAGDITQCFQIVKHKPEDFLLVSGDDLMALSMMAIGGAGVISVIANAFPAEFSAIIRKALEGDFKSAHQDLLPFVENTILLFEEGNPVGVKATLELLGLCSSQVRLPLMKGSEELKRKISKALEQLQKPVA
ncbi:4-hydroxy-tetrahydrodipicolinate synthase [Flammeovirgaceae bacterium SG7u.111]|nr:4-hydroxy-tetrahydrodipicolinate synthase [Flammeovirgaceae bacterium SG7u.132]WPO34937.1 4-hydroxy-tetrahydrodipicolinate synthase [Flammeovirgaceae bacterium SG7u.111]